MSKYSETFKRKALRDLEKINRGESIKVKNSSIEIKNVRALCLALGGISSQTLYKWKKQFEAKKSFVESQGKELKEIEGYSEEDYKTEEDPEFAQFMDIKEIPKDIDPYFNKLVIHSEIRFYGLIASVLGIKNYSNMVLPQLKLKIGLKLIKQSKLIDFAKIYEKINGD